MCGSHELYFVYQLNLYFKETLWGFNFFAQLSIIPVGPHVLCDADFWRGTGQVQNPQGAKVKFSRSGQGLSVDYGGPLVWSSCECGACGIPVYRLRATVHLKGGSET